ncbi:MAG: Ig-like domain-containing protein [Bacteroidota bacterium]
MKRGINIVLVTIISFILWKCASQTTPNGGPKDEDPPVLKKSIPTNKQKNFKGRSIELIFDELVKLNNAKEEIIITPSPGKEIKYSTKQNKVYIEPKDSWQDSTTYSIAFREGIQDINESNSPENFNLVFSTGMTIDSLEISGVLTESLTDVLPNKITVALYQEDTFDIFNHSPIYFTKTKKDSAFKIENLKAGIYNIYAFDDKNKNLKVDSKTERFGFLLNGISLVDKVDSLNIALYQIDSRLLKINSIRNTGTITKVSLNKDLISFSINSPAKSNLHTSFGDKQSEINIYNELELNDSIQLTLQGIDSLHLKVDSTFFIKRIESKMPKEKFNIKIINSLLNPETFAVEVKAQFTKPIKFINFDSIYLITGNAPERKAKETLVNKKKATGKEPKLDDSKNQSDTTSRDRIKSNSTIPLKRKQPPKSDTIAVIKPKQVILPIPSKSISIDTAKKILTIQTSVDRNLITSDVKQLSLVMEAAAIQSIESDSSRRETATLPILNAESTGTLLVEVVTKYNNFEVQLLSTDGTIIKKARDVKKFTFKFLEAKDYKLMCYADLNNNGIWDCQNIYEHTLAEPTFFYKLLDGKFTFPIRANFEVGPLIIKF